MDLDEFVSHVRPLLLSNPYMTILGPQSRMSFDDQDEVLYTGLALRSAAPVRLRHAGLLPFEPYAAKILSIADIPADLVGPPAMEDRYVGCPRDLRALRTPDGAPVSFVLVFAWDDPIKVDPVFLLEAMDLGIPIFAEHRDLVFSVV